MSVDWHLCDVFAAGVVAFQLLAGHSPFLAPDAKQVLAKNATGAVPAGALEAAGASASAVDAVRALCAPAATRPRAGAALTHEWFAGSGAAS
jgi:eukaryotic-like serine/threonine-protein kinase